MTAGCSLLLRIGAEIDIDDELIHAVPDRAHEVPLPSRLAVGELAWASVTAASLASRPDEPHRAAPDPDRIAVAYRSERFLRTGSEAPAIWAPYSGFWAASDGWIRTHGNYPHHARALRTALQLSHNAGRDEIAAAFAGETAAESIERILHDGGLAVVVGSEDLHRDADLRTRPVIAVRHIDDGARRTRVSRTNATAPLDGIRVLDLTRVVAGPVCTRTLALLGANVLRIDPPQLPEIDWQHLDTGHGKRSTLLDATSTQMSELLESADVVVLGYRPAALTRLGLSPEQLAERHPGLVIAQLSAWGADQSHRAGFDSLVQAESGIALIESSDGERPGALPAQALDHSAGYLLAAAVCRSLERRTQEGGTWHINTSLRRIAAELLGMPRRDSPAPERPIDVSEHLTHFQVDDRTLTTVRPALPGFEFAAPHQWGTDPARW